MYAVVQAEILSQTSPSQLPDPAEGPAGTNFTLGRQLGFLISLSVVRGNVCAGRNAGPLS